MLLYYANIFFLFLINSCYKPNNISVSTYNVKIRRSLNDKEIITHGLSLISLTTTIHVHRLPLLKLIIIRIVPGRVTTLRPIKDSSLINE